MLQEAGARIATRARLEFGRDEASAIARAWAQGRLDLELADRAGVPTGRHRCMSCGMRHWAIFEAVVCCSPDGWLPDRLTPAEAERLADLVDAMRDPARLDELAP